MPENDTIAAISTPLGEGGIGIVRLSGNDSFRIAKQIFAMGKGVDTGIVKPRYLYHGFIKNFDEEIIDEVLLSFMPEPHTYTRENTVEINCHSGIINLRMILELTLKAGARLAEPGEFTKRAFLNGRIDLSQAEGVLNMIRARSEEAVKIASRTIKGDLTGKIGSIRDDLIAMRAHLEAALDYPEEDIMEQPLNRDFQAKLQRARNRVKRLLSGSERNRAFQEGISIAIVGRPNVGKSSLLNALLGQQKAIVHDQPGTTRDLLEGYLNLGGYPLRLVDTAGIQGTEDPVEEEGISRARYAAKLARVLIVVFDGSVPLNEADLELLEMDIPGREVLVAVNKSDLPQHCDSTELAEYIPGAAIVKTSAIHEEGIEDLVRALTGKLDQSFKVPGESSLIVSLRHETNIKQALELLEEALEQLQVLPPEIVSYNIQEAYDKLGEITGATLNDALLDKIFSEFCLGK